MKIKRRVENIVNIFRYWFIASVAVIGLQGCTVEGGCEYFYTFSTVNYYCSDQSSEYLFATPPDSEICFYGDGNTFHEGASCSSLGYSESAGGSTYSYNSNYDPSPWGAYASSGSGSSGGATPCDYTTVWTGSPNDIQVSTICQGACVYADGGSEEGRVASCDIVAGYGATSSCWICQ